MKITPNGPFYLGPTPKPCDRHKYNAFGILKDFGKEAAEYYAKKDEEKNPPNPRRTKRWNSRRSRQPA